MTFIDLQRQEALNLAISRDAAAQSSSRSAEALAWGMDVQDCLRQGRCRAWAHRGAPVKFTA